MDRLGARLGIAAQSAVVPIVIGGEEATLRVSNQLLRQGFHVPAIRPPTVPPGTCRLRVSLTAAHSVEDVDELAAAVRGSGVRWMELNDVLSRPRAKL